MAKKRQTKAPTFEEALERLEALANELESGELKLEDAIRKYEEGVRLYARCQEILSKAEKRVQMLVRDAAGSLQEVPFEPEDTSTSEIVEDGPQKEDGSPSDDSKGSVERPRRKKTNLF